jgi:hypothetical protein
LVTVEQKSGEATVLASGIVSNFRGNPIELSFPFRGGRLKLRFIFKDDPLVKEDTLGGAEVIDGVYTVTLVNFNNHFGAGTRIPVQFFRAESVVVFLHFQVRTLQKGSDKLLTYTFFETVTGGSNG